MKRSLIMVAALATLETTAIATSNLFATRYINDPGAAKKLSIDDGNGVASGGEVASSGQVATGDEIQQSGHPGDLADAAIQAMADASAGQQRQAEAPDTPQADAGVIEAKGMIVGDDSPGTTAVGDPPGTEQVQQA